MTGSSLGGRWGSTWGLVYRVWMSGGVCDCVRRARWGCRRSEFCGVRGDGAFVGVGGVSLVLRRGGVGGGGWVSAHFCCYVLVGQGRIFGFLRYNWGSYAYCFRPVET